MRNKPRLRRALSAARGDVASRGEGPLAALAARALEAAAGAPDDALPHGFHAYPARMHPAVARAVVGWTPAEAVVLDPFCGSGTVLVEALVAGRSAVGVDLNPLAVRIAEVRCDVRDRAGCSRFLETARRVALASEARVRGRVRVRAPLSAADVRAFEPHVLLELAGLREEIRAVRDERDRRALEVVLSSMVVKFSRQRADTAEEAIPKRIGKGLPTAFFLRKARELCARWESLARAAGSTGKRPRFVIGDARRLRALLGDSFRADLVLSSPPYGGTYDYVEHHRLRFAWLGIDPRPLAAGEIGARRNLAGPDAPRRWDEEMAATLSAIARVVADTGLVVLLIGDARAGGRLVEADRQIERLAPGAGLSVAAVASQPRAPSGREHLIVLRKA